MCKELQPRHNVDVQRATALKLDADNQFIDVINKLAGLDDLVEHRGHDVIEMKRQRPLHIR